MRTEDQSVAIIGMACRFPDKAVTVDDYWKVLLDGDNACAPVPPTRWSLTRFFHPQADVPGHAHVDRANFLAQPLDRFDAGFFGLSPREGASLDPQQRLLLEVAWEALEDSGLAGEVRGSDTGVYVGGFWVDHTLQLQSAWQRCAIGQYTAVSYPLSMLSNRLSHAFDLHGPSLSVDTACSSSLVALHLACKALLSEECTLALCGGVNVMLRPETMITLSKAGLLSPDGLCKAFDAAADGYGRGEGAGIVVLKRLADALRDGDMIRAVVAGTGVNQDGRTDTITSPSVQAQRALMERVQRDAGIGPDQIQYVEAHGTGTQAGDQAESHAIGASIATRRSNGEPLWIGSAKTVIGHLEAAAGIASLIKAVLALEHRTIPPHRNFHVPNPSIDFQSLRLRIPLEPEPWPAVTGRAGAAVNAFGYGGTNAHALLLEPPARASEPIEARKRPAIFPVSAASPRALSSRIRQLADWLRSHPALDLNEIGYTQACLRPHYAHRIAFVARDTGALLEQLDRYGETPRHTESGDRSDASGLGACNLAFVYTGMGIQFQGMGAALLEHEPGARETVEQCETLWRALGGAPFHALLSEPTGTAITSPEQAQIANFVLQVVLANAAARHGLQAASHVGHSVGEITAAYLSRAISLEGALRILYHRSRLMKRLAGRGGMLAVALSPVEVARYLAPTGGRIEIAAFNGPHSVTLTGDADAIDRLSHAMNAEGVFNRRLNTDMAYHSHHLDTLEPEFLAALGSPASPASPDSSVSHAPASPLYSTVTASRIDPCSHDAAYWWRNGREPVRWGDTVTAMLNDGVNVFVEIGPHPVLAKSIADCSRLSNKPALSFALQQRDQPSITTFLDSIAQLYRAGADLDWRAHYPKGRRIALPAYPWDREHLWSETESSRLDRLDAPGHPLLSPRFGEPQPSWDGDMSAHLHPFLADHRVAGETIAPAAAAIEMAFMANSNGSMPARAIDRLTLHRALAVEETPLVRLQIDNDGDGFALYSRARKPDAPWSRYASGRFAAAGKTAPSARFDRCAWSNACRDEHDIDVDDFYTRAASLGLEFGPAFRCLRHLCAGQGESIGTIELAPAQAAEAMAYFAHPCLLDGALQTLLALLMEQPAYASKLCLPVSVGPVRIFRKAGAAAICRARITGEHNGGATGTLTLYTPDGERCATLESISIRAIGTADAIGPRAAKDWVYETRWEREQATLGPPANDDRQTWLVYADDAGVDDALMHRARARGTECIGIYPGAGYRRRGETSFDVERGSREDLGRVLAAIAPRRIGGVAYLWGLAQTRADADDAAADPRYATGLVDVLDLVHLAQMLDGTGEPGHMDLTIVTRRAQAVEAGENRTGPGQQALIALARTMRAELPGWRIRSIDVDTCDAAMAAQAVLTEWANARVDTEVAFRNEERYVARVSRVTRAALFDSSPISARFSGSLSKPDGGYLVTGGSSGLGLMSAAWLAEHGARHIAILSRRGPTDEFAHKTLANLQMQGASVWIVKCDLANRPELQESLEKLKAVMPPIRGVIHAAAAVEDASLHTLDDDAIVRVFQPKALGAWNLSQALDEHPLDFFVTYSSMTALLGNPGQAAYAAANGFLEGLVQWRRALGQSGTNIQWGVIGDIGVVARNAELKAALEKRGVRCLTAADSLQVLECALDHHWTSLGVFDVDWDRWLHAGNAAATAAAAAAAAAAARADRRVAHLLQAADGEPQDGIDDARPLEQQLSGLPAEEHWQRIYAFVRASVCRVLEIKNSENVRGNQRLNELGLDSLTAAELARTLNHHIGIAISPLALLRGLSVAELSEHVLKHARAA